MIQSLLLLVNLLMIVAVIASGVCWVKLLRRRRGMRLRQKVESLLPARVQRRPYRSNADGLAIFVTASIMLCTMAVGQQLISGEFVQRGWIETVKLDAESPSEAEARQPSEAEPNTSADLESGPTVPTASGVSSAAVSSHLNERSFIASMLANTAAGVLSILVAIGWLGLFFRQPLHVIGLLPRRDDVVIGLKAALLIIPPVLLINAAASLLIAYEHQVLSSLAAFPTSGVFVTAMLGTALVTPLVEELMLRGLLQGGLQRLGDPPPIDSSGAVEESQNSGWRPVSFWPVFAASGLFACMHLGQGAAPIALFFLSLGMGYLYRQTGNLTAPIVVHMVLNSMTLVVELLKIQIA
ncbi:MAG: CPBP family intramembrane metalloprotease [Rubripirellula sp.]|nr:CPBP family intramembrane metalloprotease [Rubripirellula sp.]